MGRKVKSKKPTRRRFSIRESRVLTHVVKYKSDNEILGITTTPYRVLTLLNSKRVLNVEKFVITDVQYIKEIPMIEFLFKHKELINIDIQKEVYRNGRILFVLEKEKAILKEKLISLRKCRDFDKHLYDEIYKTIDKINIKIYNTKYTLHKLNGILDYYNSLIEVKELKSSKVV